MKKKLAALAAMSAAVVEPVFAAVPAGVDGVFTTAATDFATLLGYGVVLAVAVWGGFMVLGQAKKLFNKTGK